MTRVCEECGSTNLGIVEVIPGAYWRKQCLDCGSTGPFVPQPKEHHATEKTEAGPPPA